MPLADTRRSTGGRDVQSEDDDAAPYLRRLDRLVRYLLRGRYGAATKLWKLQLDLLSLQQDIQARISVLKARERDAESHRRLEELRYARAQARRFGDAVAWLFLNMDRQAIVPLARNDPVRIPDRSRDEHSLRGTLVFAEAMANEGWGFPLLHDITDCLRIGDITFVRRDGEGTLTVEIKTRHRGESRNGRTVTHDYEIAAVAARPLPASSRQPQRSRSANRTSPRTPARDDRRVPRQADRLIKVKAQQDARPNDMTEIKGEPPMLSREIDADGLDRWDVLRRVARKARRCGYAAEGVDEAFVFAALYHPDGLAGDRMPSFDSLGADVMASGMLRAEHGDRNALWVNSVPEEARNSAPKYLPYFLYSLPRATILDLLHGRMVLFHLSNPAQIAAALSGAGLSVRPERGDDYRSGFDVRTMIEDDRGQSFGVGLGALEGPMREMIMEFRSVEYIVRVARGMVEAARDAMARNRARPTVS